MKYLLVLALCFTLAMMVMSQRCNSDGDCGKDQCCVAGLLTARCQKLADQFQSCRIIDNLLNGRHLYKCPCKSGFKCVGTGGLNVLGIKLLGDAVCMEIESGESEIVEEQ